MSLIPFSNIGISSDPAGRSELARSAPRYIGISSDSAAGLHIELQGYTHQYHQPVLPHFPVPNEVILYWHFEGFENEVPASYYSSVLYYPV
jgi:hypothetical protein